MPRLALNATALVTLAALSLSGCVQHEHQDRDGLVIALEAPLSGPQASNGEDMLRGVGLAVEETNRAGGVLGKPIVLVAADDAADPARALSVAAHVKANGAAAVIGPYNSSVGLLNLRQYLNDRIVPLHLTSSDDTSGLGVTVQPKNSQISPPEIAYIAAQAPTTVVLLVDPSAYTANMASRLEDGLVTRGITPVRMTLTPGLADYSALVREALDLQPQLVYSSTYFPEGALVALALASEAAGGRDAACFMGLANQEPEFITLAGIGASRRCVFSGVPTPEQLPSAAAYVAAYAARFPGQAIGTWGAFTYDSAKLLFSAITRANSTTFEPVLTQLRGTVGYAGATGPITIDPLTGNRPNVPVGILTVDEAGRFELLPAR